MKNLIKLRQESGLSQKALADALHISDKTYWSYESNRTEPNIETLIRMSKYFRVSIDFIVGNDNSPSIDKYRYSAEQLAVLEELEKIDKEQCYKLLAFIEGMKSGKEQQNKILARFRQEADET